MPALRPGQSSVADTAVNWMAVNPILPKGVFGVDSTNLLVKVGDGVTRWNDLKYCGLPPSIEVIGLDGTSNVGVANTCSRGDHKHGLPYGSFLPLDNGEASAGTSEYISRADHVHPAGEVGGDVECYEWMSVDGGDADNGTPSPEVIIDGGDQEQKHYQFTYVVIMDGKVTDRVPGAKYPEV